MTDSLRKIEVLGPGCARCKETFRIVRQVVDGDRLPFDVVKEESIERMVEVGLLATPGVAVEGKVIVSGRIPNPEEVRKLLAAV